MAILEVEHLKKTYTTRLGSNRVEALKDVNFTVERGEFVAIMGESGSGKTTLLNLLAALDKPTGGQVRLNGKNLGELKEKEIAGFRRENLGFVFQDFNLLDTFSLRDNIYLPLVLEGKKYELIEKDNRASFEMDCGHQLILDKAQGNCAMEYESVIGQGYIEMLNEEEKYEALRILMKQYRREDFPFNEKVIPMTAVFRLRVESMTGKRRTKKSNKLKIYAMNAIDNAYAPYSDFKVGACVELTDGQYITGSNVENASYGLSNCAERSAIFAAYSRGYRKEDIKAMAITTHAEKLTMPCGACRQVLSELLLPDTPILIANDKEEKILTMRELLPYSFGEDDLKK